MNFFLVLCLVLGVLSACGGGSGGGAVLPAATTGSISGKLFVGPTAAQTVVAAGAIAAGAVGKGKVPQPKVVEPAFVPGEAIVQFYAGTSLTTEAARIQTLFAADGLLQISSIPIVHAVTFSSNITKGYENGSLSASEARRQTLVLIKRLQADGHVQLASPNHINKAQAVPNDPKYSQQWDYPAIGLEQAWDITTGSPNVIVAVLDTGIFPHPDLTPNVISGYDFVSNIISAGDGNGIDPNPAAVATAKDDATHGTHVAGTIAAVSNNRVGVAGVAWQSKIMPIRVLGSRGGDNADIINGIAYAAGLVNASGTIPAKPANIINMSLGGTGSNPLVQQVIDAAVAAGVTVIAAAGNEALSGNPVEYPCAYNNVICVGAVAPDYKRSTYSETNQFVDIVAPGGEQALNPQNGILSTVWKSGAPQYEMLQGTSQATPHIAGVAALMLAAKPTLTPLQIEQMLTSTAYDLGTPGRDNEYGFGVVNAFHAVSFAKNGALPGVPSLYVSQKVFLDTVVNTSNTSVLNMGGGVLSAISAAPNAAWLTATLNQTTAPATLTLTANATGQSATILIASVAVATSAGNKNIQVFFDNRPAPNPGVVTVELGDMNFNTVATTTTSRAQGFVYQFSNIAPGDYFIAAGVDRDGSGTWGDNWGEYIGTYPLRGSLRPVTVTAGGNILATNFQLHKTDEFVQFDGNGETPIRGAVLARVKDAEGNPIAGAKVYIGNGATNSGATNALGQTTIFGGFNGPQTVTATAPGYSTLTYWQTNASYLTFSLEQLTTANVTLNVTLTGLITGETGVLFAGSAALQTFTATATQMTFNVPQQNRTPIAISAITYNAFGASDLFASTSLPAGIIAATNVSLAMAAPAAWVNFSGSMTYPAGNFNVASGVGQAAFGFIYLGLNQPLFFNGYQSVANPAVVSVDMALTNIANADPDPKGNAVALLAVNGVGESSMVMQLGSLLSTAPTALPTTGVRALVDVPALVSPVAGQTTASLTPAFIWSNTFTPMLELLNIEDPVTQQTVWEVDIVGTVSSVTLPNIPTGGLKALRNYQWNVDNMVFQSFDFNNFDANKATQSTTDFSTSQTFSFATP